MTEAEILEFVTGLAGVDMVVASEASGAPEAAWGDTFFFYDPDGSDPGDRRMPFATIVVHDYEGFDTRSDLDRDGVFRLNLWVDRDAVRRLLGEVDDRDETPPIDYTSLDTLLPHPVYASQGWVSILNPGPRTSELARTLLAEAHERAVGRHQRRTA